MRKLTVLFIVLMLTVMGFSQKIGFINTDSVLVNFPEMQDAQKKLNSFLLQAQKELQAMQQEYKQKAVDFENSKDTLDKFILDQRRKDLEDLNKKIQDFQVNAQTQYLQMQRELLTPIQDKFNKAVEKIAKQKGYISIIQITPQIIYYDPKYDITDLVIKELNKK